MSASHPHFRSFFTLRLAFDRNRALARFWRAMALRCAKEVHQCERDASACAEASVRAAAEAIVAQQREESRAHADRLADVLAWLESPELVELERATVARLEEERR